jgi:DNA-binding MarR family transcriptional regulator
MSVSTDTDDLAHILRDTLVALVRRDGRDLTAKQLGVLLICYVAEGAQTVRSLARTLDVERPTVSKTLDRLAELNLVKRIADPADYRSVLVGRTNSGVLFINVLGEIAATAAAPLSPPRR